MTLPQEIINKLNKIFQDAFKQRRVEIYVFGSWANGNPTQTSDIDLAINSQDTLPPGILASLRESLDDSTIPYRVEVVDLSTADHAFKQTVLTQGILWNDFSNAST